MNFKKFLKKLQNLPDTKKKIILWTIVAVLAVVMGYFWVNSAEKGFSKIAESTKSIKFPAINLPTMPSLDSILQTTTPSNANPIK
ncbi:MAG: hypothetical protein ABSA74_02265 [Candidatus Staskawiczbacteria bacterium]|jgi:hypothetical protein